MKVLSVLERDLKTPVGPRKGKDYALFIATDEYDHGYWVRLRNPIYDAQDVAAELQNRYGFEPPKMVLNPTRDELFAALTEISAREYQPDDQLLIFIAGHGDFNTITRTGFVVARNSLPPDSDPSRSTYAPLSEIRGIIENGVRCQHVLLLLDVCYAGTIDFATATDFGTPTGVMRGGEPEKVLKSEFIARKLKYKTRRFVASVPKTPASDGPRGLHSPFATRLLQALQSSGEADGILTFYEIWQYLDVPATTSHDQPPLMGELLGNEPQSDFLLIASQQS
jgi:hypothetical protein